MLVPPSNRSTATRWSAAGLWALLWIIAAQCDRIADGADLPEFAAALTFTLTLYAGVPGLAAAVAGGVVCYLGSAAGAPLSTGPTALHFLVYGACALVLRRSGLSGRPARLRELAAWWLLAAVAALLAVVSAEIPANTGQNSTAALYSLGMGWLRNAAGISLVLVPFWSLADNAVVRSLHSVRRAAWVPAVLLSCVSVAVFSRWPQDLSSGGRLALCTLIALSGSGAGALGAGLLGAATHGLLLAAVTVWMAGRSVPLQPWPAWLAVLAALQPAASVLAVLVESRAQLAAALQTAHRESRQQLSKWLQLAAEHGSDIISVHDHRFDFCYASPRLHTLLGLAPEDELGPVAALLPRLHPADRPAALTAAVPPAGRWRFRVRGGDHHWHWLESAYTVVHEGEARYYVAITRDIGAHVEQTESLHAMALHDPLTQLYNRRAAATLGERLWEDTLLQRLPCAVILLDIDHFKKINDTYGHDVGDQVIKHLAAILPAHTRQRDLVCRWGGEEFLILLPESDVDGACQIAERIRGEVASTTVIAGDVRVQIHISAGVAARDGDTELAALIERADQGLYAAKEQGRNQVVSLRTSGSWRAG